MKVFTALWFLLSLGHVASESLRGAPVIFESLPGNNETTAASKERNLKKEGFPYTTKDPFHGATRRAEVKIFMNKADVCSFWNDKSDPYVDIWLMGDNLKGGNKHTIRKVGRTKTVHQNTKPNYHQWFNAGKFTDKQWNNKRGEETTLFFHLEGRDWDRRSGDERLGRGDSHYMLFGNNDVNWEVYTNHGSDCGHSRYYMKFYSKATYKPYKFYNFPKENISPLVGKQIYAKKMGGRDATLACHLEGMKCCGRNGSAKCEWKEERGIWLREGWSPWFMGKDGYFKKDYEG